MGLYKKMYQLKRGGARMAKDLDKLFNWVLS